MKSRLLMVGGVMGLAAVVVGSTLGHALPRLVVDGELVVDAVDPARLFWTGLIFHLAHAPAIMALAAFPGERSLRVTLAALAFVVGIVLFCVPLYLLAFGGGDWLVWVVPVGGMSLLIGWLCAILAAAGGRDAGGST